MVSARQLEIIKATIRIIAERGIQYLTTKNLAAALSISEAALYRHFKNKHSILMAVLDMFRDFSRFEISENDTTLTSLEKIRAFLFDRYHKFSRQPNMARVLFSEEIFQYDAELSQKLLSIMQSHAEVVQRIIQEGQAKHEIREDVDAQAMFRVIVGSMRLLVNQWCLGGFRFDLVTAGENLWQNLKKMLI